MLNPGQQAPDFTLNDQNGTPITLSDYLGKKVVLYFYPKDSTPGCTKEACNFRDNIDTFKSKDIIVLGISTDSEKSHQRFFNKQNLNFPLLSDIDKKVVTAYGVWGEKSMYGRKYMGTSRKTFLIDEKGLISKTYDKVKVSTHAEDVLKDLNII